MSRVDLLATAALDAMLHPDEAALANALPTARRSSFVAGRAALRTAIAHADARAMSEPILRTPRGAPRLPKGIVGSVSHKRSVAVALVAPDASRGGTVATLGIDVEERPRAGQLLRDIAPRILLPSELDQLPTGSTEARQEAVLLFFALKEAIYKAIDPFVHRHVRFREVEVQLGASEVAVGGSVSVQLHLPEFEHGAPVVFGSWQRDNAHIIAIAGTESREGLAPRRFEP